MDSVFHAMELNVAAVFVQESAGFGKVMQSQYLGAECKILSCLSTTLSLVGELHPTNCSLLFGTAMAVARAMFFARVEGQLHFIRDHLAQK